MALPTSGQLSYSQINVELGNLSTSQASMFAMATSAGKSTSNASVSNFYGYSHADSVVYSWTSASTPITTTTTFDWYKTLDLAGLNASNLRPYVTVGLTSVSNGSITFYWSKNSTSTWNSFSTRSSVGTTSYYLPTSSKNTIASGDVLRVRMLISRSTFGNVAYTATITSTYSLGAGPALGSYTAGSPTTWTGSF